MVKIFIPDNSVITGAGVTGLTYQSTNLRISYLRDKDAALTSYIGANIETVSTLGTYQAPSSSSKCRFKETAIPGVYEIHFHNDATAFGAADTSEKVIVLVAEDTTTDLKIGPCAKEIQLTAFDLQTATVDMGKINGSAAAAIRLALSTGQIITGTVDDTVAPTTTEFEADDITEATADHYKGRVIIFTTGALAGQGTTISSYSLAGGKGHFVVVTLTEAPANNDTFIIV